MQSVLENAYPADIGAGIVLILEYLCVELGSLIPEISENILSLNVFLESNGLKKNLFVNVLATLGFQECNISVPLQF